MSNDTRPTGPRTPEAAIGNAEVVLWVTIGRRLTPRELERIARAAQAVIDASVAPAPFVSYYHEDGTKS